MAAPLHSAHVVPEEVIEADTAVGVVNDNDIALYLSINGAAIADDTLIMTIAVVELGNAVFNFGNVNHSGNIVWVLFGYCLGIVWFLLPQGATERG